MEFVNFSEASPDFGSLVILKRGGRVCRVIAKFSYEDDCLGVFAGIKTTLFLEFPVVSKCGDGLMLDPFIRQDDEWCYAPQ